jgi:hypothetical protein
MPTITASTRADALERIFTQEVQRYAEQAGLSPSQALKEFCETNPDLWKEYSEQVRELSRKTASGSRLSDAVNAFAKEHGCSYRDALNEVTAAHPELWSEYSAETMPVQGTPLPGDSSTALAAEMIAYSKEHKCSLSVALCEIGKANPALILQWREEIAAIV